MNRVEKVRARYVKELADAECEDVLEALLPFGGRIHLYALHGAVAGVTYGDEHHHDGAVSTEVSP